MHSGSQITAVLQLQNRISTLQQKNDGFKACFEKKIKKKIINTKLKNCCENSIYTSQPLQCRYIWEYTNPDTW